jgi:plastocyanin
LLILKWEVSLVEPSRLEVRMRVMAIVAFAIVLSAATMAEAARVTGKIVISPELLESITALERKTAESGRAYYWNEPNGIAPVRPPQIDPSSDIAVVVTKEGAPSPGPDELSTVKVRAGSMEPRVITTRPGSTIRFRNVDPLDHELYSPNLPNFRPEHQSNGAFRPIEFSEEGIFEIKCKLFSHFKAYVVVTKSTFIVPVQKDGSFSLSDLQDGKYILKVFHEGK